MLTWTVFEGKSGPEMAPTALLTRLDRELTYGEFDSPKRAKEALERLLKLQKTILKGE